MRSITEARTQWQELKDFKSLNDYKLSIHSQTADHPLISRSIYWKTFLLFESSDHSEWLRRLGHSRSAYASLRNHFLRGLQHSDELDVEADPLSEDSAVSASICHKHIKSSDCVLRFESLHGRRCVTMRLLEPRSCRMSTDVCPTTCTFASRQLKP